MSIEAALYSYLSGVAGVTALVGTRIYPLEAPQNGAFPCITYQTVSFPHIDSLEGSSGLAHPRIQITCWARNVSGGARGYTTAGTVRDAVRAAIDGFKGVWDTTNIDHAFIVDEGDIFEPSTGVEADRTYGRRIDVEVWHQESQPSF